MEHRFSDTVMMKWSGGGGSEERRSGSEERGAAGRRWGRGSGVTVGGVSADRRWGGSAEAMAGILKWNLGLRKGNREREVGNGNWGPGN
ncbi:hypothetical protein E3N88_04666 [Mikania micrantha]|uniref:Uncharacterized protein n=1 Tax=Mikania micrantha TaxID=192012 RepID=A0A5N6PX76_9ASTR|nr:hypothetical protein E3N88_04666 [Mikania micrantha]